MERRQILKAWECSLKILNYNFTPSVVGSGLVYCGHPYLCYPIQLSIPCPLRFALNCSTGGARPFHGRRSRGPWTNIAIPNRGTRFSLAAELSVVKLHGDFAQSYHSFLPRNVRRPVSLKVTVACSALTLGFPFVSIHIRYTRDGWTIRIHVSKRS